MLGRFLKKNQEDRSGPTKAGRSSSSYWAGLLVGLIWLLIWQLAYLAIGKDLLLASPAQVLASLVKQAGQKQFYQSTILSLLRIQAGFLLGLVFGSILALSTSRFVFLHRFFAPAIGAIRATPVASFIILALVWMSSSNVVIFIVFLMVLPIVWANVAEGIQKTDRQLLEMAQVFSLSRWEKVRYIYLPSIAPFFTAAASTGLGLGWKAGVAAEVLSRPRFSLGSRLYDAKIYLETADLLAYTLLVVVISLLLEKLLLFLLAWISRQFKLRGLADKGGQA